MGGFEFPISLFIGKIKGESYLTYGPKAGASVTPSRSPTSRTAS